MRTPTLRMPEEGAAAAGSGTSTGAVASNMSLIDQGASTATGSAASATAATPIVGESWWKSWAKEDGSLDHARLEKLPEETKGLKTWLSQFKTFDDFIRTVQHQNGLVGKKGLMKLRDGASDQERKEFRERMMEVNGVPPTAKEYGIARPESLPEEMWVPEAMDEFAELFHEAAVPPDAVKKIIDKHAEWNLKLLQKNQEAEQKSLAEWKKNGEQQLREAFGFDKDNQIELAKRTLRLAGVSAEQLPEWFTDNAGAIVTLARIGGMLGEDKFVASDRGGPNGSSSMTAMEQIMDMRSNPQNRYHRAIQDKSHPMYSQAVAERERLGKLAAREAGHR